MTLGTEKSPCFDLGIHRVLEDASFSNSAVMPLEVRFEQVKPTVVSWTQFRCRRNAPDLLDSLVRLLTGNQASSASTALQ